jgi:uncharacterized protein (TIGR03435 family)
LRISGVYSEMRTLLLSAALLAAPLHSQQFEVASVKPSPQTPSVRGIKIDGGRVDIQYWSMKQLILRAYEASPYQISGPDWLETARFDVLAKIPEGAPREQVSAMLQSLLAERFGLVTHRETRDLTVFALTVAKDGPKMKAAAADSGEPPDAGRILDGLWGREAPFGMTSSLGEGHQMHMAYSKVSMAALTQILTVWMREPVIDATGLTGLYQAALDFSADTDAAANSLFVAVKPLGLALERRKVPVSMLIVDHVEKTPKEN